MNAATSTAFDPELVSRYNGAAPRYTSYPPASMFTPDFDVRDHEAAIADSNTRGGPLSVYVHLPFCSSPCFYCGCTRLITRQPAVIAHYLQQLQEEIRLGAAQLDAGRELRQLHLGGGTPSLLDPDQLGELIAVLARVFQFSSDPSREFSIEIDPRAIHPQTVPALARLGFNRLSVGVQDFDPAVQRAVNREQSLHETLHVIAQARLYGFRSVSIDLICGLPRQTVQGFERTIAQVLALQPERLSIYGYAHMPERFLAQRKIAAAELPSPREKLLMMQLAAERLLAAGYLHIGLDHFARQDDELAKSLRDGTLQRNFQGYSTHGGLDLAAFGMSAISRFGESYSQNTKSLDLYYRALDDRRLPIERGYRMSAEDRLRADVIAALMCKAHVDLAAIERAHGVDFAHHFSRELAALQPMVDDGLLRLDGRQIEITASGRFLLRAIAATFDATADRAAATTRHSQVL